MRQPTLCSPENAICPQPLAADSGLNEVMATSLTMMSSDEATDALLQELFEEDAHPMAGDVASQHLEQWSFLLDASSDGSDLFLLDAADEAAALPEPLSTHFIPPPPPSFDLPSLPAVPAPTSKFCIPTLDASSMCLPTLAVDAPTVDASRNDKRHYRQTVAIPRYLEKRKRRKWEREIMHKSRSEAAFKRPRKTGKFHRVGPVFVPVAQLNA